MREATRMVDGQEVYTDSFALGFHKGFEHGCFGSHWSDRITWFLGGAVFGSVIALLVHVLR